ncbi:uncharacterized protein LOC124156515 [Ischnura elegans]|uniref:uncharacterized protein LOC124156515 n=1 Tax=Ischnura elegans TaxID=197161 RepID=UPI001ED8A632|nr:uncharacterized protein LOC124156515 [Ischnura elegans]
MRARTPFSLSAVQINGCIRSNMTTTAAMRVWTFVGTFLAFNSAASGLMCYKCSEMARPPSNRTETTPPCSRFDPYAPEFQVECADSTFCMKKTFELVLQNGQTVKGESRGCAPQSYNYHSYSEGVGWTVKTAVEETAYEDGCTRDTANPSGVKAPSTEHCYCARHLCNSAASTVARRGGGSGSSKAQPSSGGGEGLGGRVVEAGRRAGEVVGQTVAAAAHHTDAMAVIIVFNAVKYIRSLRGEDIY